MPTNTPEPATLRDYLSLLRRRRAMIFAVFSIMALTIVGGTSLVEDQFRSAAVIAIEKPQIPESMARSTVTDIDTDLRIDRITNAVLGRERVEAWVQEYNLYPNLTAESLGAAVSEFRDDVAIITIQEDEDIATKDQGDTIAFEVAYFGQSAAEAHLIAGVLANEYIEENRRSRNRSVEETHCCSSNAKRRRSRRGSTWRKRNSRHSRKRMPRSCPNRAHSSYRSSSAPSASSTTCNARSATCASSEQIQQSELEDVSPYMAVYSTSGETLLSDSERLEAMEREYIQLSSRYGPEHPDVVAARRQLNMLRSGNGGRDIQTVRVELDVAKLELNSLQDRYTADHPDVRDAERRIRSLEDELSILRQSPAPRSRSEPDNPEYIQLQVRIRAANEDLAALAVRERDLRARLREYDNRMLMAPQVEKELLALTRNYEQAIREYNDVREKQTDARRAKELELAEKGERYVLQVPPNEPFGPAFPDRIAIIVLGLFFSIAAGIGLAVVVEAVDGTVRSVRDLKLLTGAPPMVIVPNLETASEHRNRVLAWSFSIVLVSGLLVTLISVQLL